MGFKANLATFHLSEQRRKAHEVGDFERIKEQVSIRDFAEQFLTKSRGGQWCCPYCGSGTHNKPDSDGALSIYEDTASAYCHSCHRKADVFDLAAVAFHLSESDRVGQLEAVAKWAGLTLDGGAKVDGGSINLGESSDFAGQLTRKNCLVTNMTAQTTIFRGVVTLGNGARWVAPSQRIDLSRQSKPEYTNTVATLNIEEGSEIFSL